MWVPVPLDPDAVSTPAWRRPTTVTGVWYAVAPAMRMRPGVRTTAAMAGWAGIVVNRRARMGVSVAAAPPAGLRQLPGERRVQALDVLVGGFYATPRPTGWDVGPVVGGTARWYREAGADPVSTWVPVAGGTVAHRQDVGAIAVRIALQVQVDGLATQLLVDRELQSTLSPLGANLSVGLTGR